MVPLFQKRAPSFALALLLLVAAVFAADALLVRAAGLPGAQTDPPPPEGADAAGPDAPTADCITDDIYEDNDSLGTATPFAPGPSPRLYLCDADRNDYYAVEVPAGHTLQVDLTFSHRGGDINLTLYDSSGSFVTDSSSLTDDESAKMTVAATGTYYVRANLSSGTENTYAMRVRVSCADCISYQGRLDASGAPADGDYEFEFALYDAAGSDGELIAGPITRTVPVSAGVFAADLYFGETTTAYPATELGQPPYLAIGVRPAGSSNPFTTLTPRQLLTAVPAAHTLRPGALVTGTVPGAGAFNVGNRGPAGDGLVVESVEDDGVQVNAAGGDGLAVCSTGSESGCSRSALNNGLEIGNAEGSGVWVDSAGDNGVQVNSAVEDGVVVGSTGIDGVVVGSAGFNGVRVFEAGSDGVVVTSAGENGVEVGSAAANGVFVGSAGNDGVRVNLAGGDGVWAATNNTSAYGGAFYNIGGGGEGAGLYAEANQNSAPDIVLGGSGAADNADDGRLSSDPAYPNSDLIFESNDRVRIYLDQDNSNSSSFFAISNSDNVIVFSVDESGNVSSSGSAVTLADAGAYGAVEVYGVQSTENWFEDFGSGTLVDGGATVAIDPTFAAAVNLAADYHVYLTPLGDCALYVAEKTAADFSVSALGGATCTIDFDYRIVARRAGY